MSIHPIANYNDTSIKYTGNDNKKEIKEEAAPINNGDAAVYEKTVDSKKVHQRDQATIDRLLSEAEASANKLRDLVERMLLRQGETMDKATDIYGLLREGKIHVDEGTRLQAQKDIAEDGYWGVEQTSERLLSFAKALSGGDPSMADKMIDAVKKGFEQAEKAWGDSLPQISRDTLDRTISKMESWRDSLNDK
ncbi:MAG: hypothetical protein GX271_01920 [Clostridiales bacterium]|jgi:hypothetical protein|nr:hypothetical protein [Clostridiales bacterium]